MEFNAGTSPISINLKHSSSVTSSKEVSLSKQYSDRVFKIVDECIVAVNNNYKSIRKNENQNISNLSRKVIDSISSKKEKFTKALFIEIINIFQKTINKDFKSNVDDININKAYEGVNKIHRYLRVKKNLLDAARGKPIKFNNREIQVAYQFEADANRQDHTHTAGDKTFSLVDTKAILSEFIGKNVLNKIQFENYSRLANQNSLVDANTEVINLKLPNGQTVNDVAFASNVGRTKFDLKKDGDNIIITASCDFKIVHLPTDDIMAGQVLGYVLSDTIMTFPDNELSVLWEKEKVKMREVAPNMTVEVILSPILSDDEYKGAIKLRNLPPLEIQTLGLEEFENTQRPRRGDISETRKMESPTSSPEISPRRESVKE